MKRFQTALAVAILSTATLTACSSQLSLEDAGNKYLEIVCPGNAAWDALGEVDQSDLQALTSAASKTRDILQEQAKRLGDKSIQWPAGVPELLSKLQASTLLDLSYVQEMAKASSIDDFFELVPPDQSEIGAVAQEVRLLLELPADTTSSCVGFN